MGIQKEQLASFEELLEKTNLANAKVIETEETFMESLARFITNPIIVPILLSIASLGLIVELYSPGFGVARDDGTYLHWSIFLWALSGRTCWL